MSDPRPTDIRPIEGFKKPFLNVTIEGDIITYEFIPSETEDNEKRYEYAKRYLPKGATDDSRGTYKKTTKERPK